MFGSVCVYRSNLFENSQTVTQSHKEFTVTEDSFKDIANLAILFFYIFFSNFIHVNLKMFQQGHYN